MGAINLIFEGPTDQYLFSEGIRLFSGTEGMTDLLDLNSVVIVSAESAPGVEKLIAASQWSDEPLPVVVVVLDSDEAGRIAKDRITGQTRSAKKLLDTEQVIMLADVIAPFDENQVILTIEDLIPASLYRKGVQKYLERWYTREEVTTSQLEDLIKPGATGTGLAAWAKSVFESLGQHDKGFDKLGVMQEVIQLLGSPAIEKEAWTAFGKNILNLSRKLREKVDFSQKLEQQRSAKQALHRIIGEFFVQHKASCTTHALEILLSRLQREAPSFGQDSSVLANKLAFMAAEIKDLRSKGIMILSGTDWTTWRVRLESLRSDPLGQVPTSLAMAEPLPPEESVTAS